MVKNIKTGQLHRTHSLVKTKLDENYLRDLNKQANSEENYIHRTILDHSLRDIIHDFTNSTINIIDDAVSIIEEKNKESEESDDILDWVVNYMNIGYEILHLIMNKNNALNIFNNTSEDPMLTFSNMKSYKNYIISNSSFSMFAAFIGSNEKSLIFYPQPWFKSLPHTSFVGNNWNPIKY